MCVCHSDSDREDSATESKSNVVVVPPKQMSSALGSLLANYGSMSESDSGDEPEGKFAIPSGPRHPGIFFWIFVKCLIAMAIIPQLCSFVSAISIQRTKDLLQENQALLHLVPASNKDTGRSTNTIPFPDRADTHTFHQQNAVLTTPQNKRGGRGRGRRGGRGEHQDTPQSRRPTLLEMVKTLISNMYFIMCKL